MDQLDAAAWANLERLEKGTVLLDMRYASDRMRIPGYLKLYDLGYCTLKETGPGDSIHIFKLTPAGAAALAARRGG